MTRLAFFFDSGTCSGCKTCQMACKDKNDLPVGQTWRRVYEVSGGGWTKEGATWKQDVFAYNLSLSCNHCEDPICAGHCPTRAIGKREDGIVQIDQGSCMGCKYCSWVCPYGAPQFNPEKGVMGKCDLCADYVDQGKNPSCVDACPMRALDFGDYDELLGKYGESGHVHPLPDPSITDPSAVIRAHQKAGGRNPAVANAEETNRTRSKDGSLVFFTTLSQWSVGIIACMTALGRLSGDATVLGETGVSPANPVFLALILVLAATTMSFLHLGNPANAPRALKNLATSWLSREILAIGVYSVSLVAVLGVARVTGDGRSTDFLLIPASVAGVILLWTMARVYLVPTVPAWNNGYTPLSFATTALCLGLVTCLVFDMTGVYDLDRKTSGFCMGLLLAVLALEWLSGLLHRNRLAGMDAGFDGPVFDRGTLNTLFLARMSVLVVACLALLIPVLQPGHYPAPWLFPVLLLVVLQEFAGRRLFYASYFRTGL